MSIIKCTECGKEISNKAPSCIYCGYPIAEMYIDKNYDIMVLSYKNRENIIPEDKNIYNLENELINQTYNGSVGLKFYKWHDYIYDHFCNMYGKKFPITVFHNLSKECADFISDIFIRHKCQVKIVESTDISNQEDEKIQLGYEANKDKIKSAIKCPTCGSTNTEKISTTSKVVGAAAFGIFSKTARSQFKCNHCGYKW